MRCSASRTCPARSMPSGGLNLTPSPTVPPRGLPPTVPGRSYHRALPPDGGATRLGVPVLAASHTLLPYRLRSARYFLRSSSTRSFIRIDIRHDLPQPLNVPDMQVVVSSTVIFGVVILRIAVRQDILNGV